MRMATPDAVGSTGSTSANSARPAAVAPSSSRWIFTQEQLLNTPSIREGMHPEEELKRRRAAAQTIHQMADRLNHDSRVRISQLCICAAMMHMHRFFVFHSFYKFDPRDIAAACLFLAGKSEECPRKLEHIVRVWWAIKFPHTPNLEANRYHDAAQLIVTLENVILQTIAFDLSVDIPHTFVLNHMQNFARGGRLAKSNVVNSREEDRGSRKISEIAYWFASDMLHMTNWGVRFPARSIACVCIHLACLWAQFEIQMPPGSPPWYETVDPTMTANRLLELAEEFSHIYKTYGEQLNIKKYAMRNSVANAAQNSQGQVRRNSQSQPSNQAASSSLASLPPPPPAPELTTTPVKAEVKTEPARRIDLSDYKQRAAGGLMASTSAQNTSQLSGQRRNFMQPDVSQGAAVAKASADFDLPLPPAIANEKKAAAPQPEQEMRQKRRAEEMERENVKHRRPDKSDKPLVEGPTSQHRKRTHERTSVNMQHEGTPAAPASHHSISGGYSSVGSSSSSLRHHDGGPSSSKRPKPASSLSQLVPPPLPPASASNQVTASAQRMSSSLTSGSQQSRGSSHGPEPVHRSGGSSSSMAHEPYGSGAVNSTNSSMASGNHRHSSSMTSSSRVKSSRESASSTLSLEMANGGHSSSAAGSHTYSKRPSRLPTSPPLPPPPSSNHSNRNVTPPSSHQNSTYSGRDEDNRRRRRSSMEIKEQHLMSIRHQAHMPNRYCRVGGGGGGTYGNCKWLRGVVSHRGSYRYGEHSAWNRAGQRSNYNYKQFQGGFQQRRFRNCARWNKNNDAAILRQDAFASYNTSSLPRPASPSFHSHFSSSPPPRNSSRMLSTLPPPPPPPPNNDELEDGEVL